MSLAGGGLAMWKDWTVVGLPMSFRQVKKIRSKLCLLGLTSNSITAYLVGRVPRHHAKYREKLKPIRNGTKFETGSENLLKVSVQSTKKKIRMELQLFELRCPSP